MIAHLHPISVHFPVALLSMAGGLYAYHLYDKDFFYFRAAKLSHIVGLIGLILAMLTGRSAAGEIEANDPITEIVRNHEILGYASIWAFSMLLVWVYLREKSFSQKEKLVYTCLYVLFLGLMGYGSFLGGTVAHPT